MSIRKCFAVRSVGGAGGLSVRADHARDGILVAVYPAGGPFLRTWNADAPQQVHHHLQQAAGTVTVN